MTEGIFSKERLSLYNKQNSFSHELFENYFLPPISPFLSLLILPKYLINWPLRPVLIAFVLYIIGFFMLDLVHIVYVLYALIGLEKGPVYGIDKQTDSSLQRGLHLTQL